MAFASPAFAEDELARLNRLILENPTDIAVNLQYAHAAEAIGDYPRALAAYERVLFVDPGNLEAVRGQSRASARMTPNSFEVSTEIGGGYETNPHNGPVGAHGEGELFARTLLKDERTIGDTRWRTTGLLSGNAYQDSGDLGYAYGGAATGPVYVIAPNLSVHIAAGGGAAYFDRHFFFSESFASVAFEGNSDFLNYSIRFRGGYRQYDDFFPLRNGFFADFTTRFVRANIFFDDDTFTFSPWLRWSGIDTSNNLINIVSPDDLKAGRYGEYGTRVEYYKPVADWLTVSANFAWIGRIFANAVDPTTNLTVGRIDQIYAPGAALIFTNKNFSNSSIRVDYRYERDDSNTPTGSYTNHVALITYFNRY